MKAFKKIILAVAIFAILIVANGTYYLFRGQFTSMEKILSGKKLNAYEICSIYSLHSAIWMFGWPISPAASYEMFLMQFRSNKANTISIDKRRLRNSLLSPRILTTMRTLRPGESKKISYDGNVAYGLANPEHKAALAINPCVISRKDGFFVIKTEVSWPKYVETSIKLRNKSIILYEGLFRYIQDKKLIHGYTVEYIYPENEILAIFQ